ncbi:IQ motif and SEC7 domain-containing protein 3-like [Chiloscyllium plagiosum]|uniref:IQ motif and SEC7 domain-containing protein 3-like n=1 Tax=Chiloscyllium plagiosum TaxID=36176 RepID=UPI001CB82513|nr:IQ motif and SEC7 domain-containing protein 3-like [Chiloscyllium plagiosum]
MESLMENPMRAVLYLKELTTIVQNQQTLIQTQRHRIHELELKVEELLEENQSLRDQPANGGGHHRHHHHHHHHHQQQEEQEQEQEQEQQRDLQQHHQDPQHKHPTISSTRAVIPCNPENENVLHQFCCPAADADQKLPSSTPSSSNETISPGGKSINSEADGPMKIPGECEINSSDRSGMDQVKCSSADVKEGKSCRMIPVSNTMVQKASLHHTASPMRMQRSKGTATCSHLPTSDYELSMDLKNKQIEMLEHKYGGHLVSRRAACTIQTAFRQYQLSKNFEKIRNSLLESRMPRRISLRKVRLQNAESLMEGYNFAGIPLVRSPSLPASISGALTELEDSFTEQVKSLAKSIDDALSSWSLKTMCSLQDGSSYQFTETFSSASMQDRSGGEMGKTGQESSDDKLEDGLAQSGSTLMMAFRDVTFHIENKNMSVSSLMESASVAMANCENAPPESEQNVVVAKDEQCPREEREKGSQSSSSEQEQMIIQNNHPFTELNVNINSNGLGGDLVGQNQLAMQNIQIDHNNGIMPDPQLESNRLDNAEQLSSSSTTSISAKSPSEVSSKEALHAMILSMPRYHCENPSSCKSPTLSTDIIRKRLYRIGLNLFNVNPDKGIQFLIARGFIPDTAIGVAHFLLQRKGLSRQMIGEFLGNSKKQFNRDVLDCVVDEMDFSNMELDEALRKFQAHIRVQGEAQKVERLIEAFRLKQICSLTNWLGQVMIPLGSLGFSSNGLSKSSKHVRALRSVLPSVDDGVDIPREMVVGIYERIQQKELKSNEDHVTYVTKVEKSIVGMKAALSVPHRRLVCCSRLFEIMDINKAQKQAAHQREVFLFNDLVVILKLCAKKRSSATYTFYKSVGLLGMQIHLFETEFYPHGITLISSASGSEKKQALSFCAQSSEELQKFVEELKESIAEVTEMEQIRIDWELEKQQGAKTPSSKNNGAQLDIRTKPGSPAGKKESGENKTTNNTVEVSIHNRLQAYQHSSEGNQECAVQQSTLLNFKQENSAVSGAMDHLPETLLQCQQIVNVIVVPVKPDKSDTAQNETPIHQVGTDNNSTSSTPRKLKEDGLQGTPVKNTHQPPLPPPPPPYNHPHQYCPPNPFVRRRRYSSGSRSLV